MDRTLLLVTGSGRSGTSTVAGALALLGVPVPGPYLKANESNPKGFYESKWSVDFHNRLLKRANVSIADGRPDAPALVLDAVREEELEQLRGWITEHTRDHPLTALKDPRTAWTLSLWESQARALGVRLVSVTMLRHPAGVLGSRSTHYPAGIETMGEQGFRVRNLAGWVNAVAMTEAQTRGWPRSFVGYDDLLTDWRQAMRGVAADLDLDPAALAPDGPHPVDDFVDPSLSRHGSGWSEPDLRADLREIADQIWAACLALAGVGGHDEAAQASLDEAKARYDELYDAARQLTHDATVAEASAARHAGARAAAKRVGATQPTGVLARVRGRLSRHRS